MDYHDFSWVKEFPAAITVSDAQGIILEMNDKAAASFADDGGIKLIGTNMLDCHPESARQKLEGLMERRERNVYTIEKNGVHKLIFQTPWYQEGKYAGFIEMAFEIPAEMPHFIRS
jgi:transcriptional regulator with PAS, ATPase and Fis domain